MEHAASWLFAHVSPRKPDEIIQALNDMDNSASSDAVVREKIAKLPPEVQDVSLLDKIQGWYPPLLQ